jgi:hypothetical protein
MDEIRVTYSTVDGYRVYRTFKTLKGASRFAVKWIGETPEVSTTFNYAVGPSGCSKITSNIPVGDLFPKLSSDRGEPAEEF